MTEYDPQKDAHDSYYAAIEAKRARGDRDGWRTILRSEIIGDCTLLLGNCVNILPILGGFDVIITDPPYGVTGHGWDNKVHPSLWMLAPAVCFAAEPFATELINGAPQEFKYDLVWSKNTATNLENCKIRPARTHERILIFGRLPYEPQKRKRSALELLRLNAQQRLSMEWANPGSVLEFEAVNNRSAERTKHQSQKPTDLMSWLLRSYSLPSNTVLDPFMGSGSTGVACAMTGRSFVGIELEPKWFDLACERIRKAYAQPDFFIEPRAPEPVQEALL